MKKTPLMLIVAVVMVLAAVFLSRRDQVARTPASEIGKPLLSGFEELLAGGSVHTMTLKKGAEQTTLELGDSGWRIKEQFGYPVDFAKLQRTLLGLAEVKVGQVMRGMRLSESDTTTIKWLGQDNKELASLNLGQTRKTEAPADQPWMRGEGGRFVTRGADDTVYLVSDSLSDFSADPKNWLDTQILSLPSADIAKIQVAHADGETYTLSKVDGDLTLDNVGEDEEFDTTKRYTIGGALSYLRFAELADPSLDEDTTGIATGAVFRATDNHGKVYEARLGGSPEGKTERYVKVSVTVPPAEPEEAVEGEAESIKSAREARAKEREELAKAAQEQNTKLSPWLFLISNSNAETLSTRRATLVKPKEEPAVEEPESADKPEKSGDNEAATETTQETAAAAVESEAKAVAATPVTTTPLELSIDIPANVEAVPAED
jgi:hypothetical protein